MKVAVYEADGSATVLDVPQWFPELRRPIHRNLTYLAQQGVAETYKIYRLYQDPRGTKFYRFTHQA